VLGAPGTIDTHEELKELALEAAAASALARRTAAGSTGTASLDPRA
jgi:hypothetical protein